MSILQAVTHAEGEALAKSYGIPFYETSAKRGTGVDAAFSSLAHLVAKRLGTAGHAGHDSHDPRAVHLDSSDAAAGSSSCAC